MIFVPVTAGEVMRRLREGRDPYPVTYIIVPATLPATAQEVSRRGADARLRRS